MRTIFCALTLLGLFPMSMSAQYWAIQMRGGDPAMHILCDNELVMKYYTKGAAKPFFYPIIGPTGEGVTRGFPMDPQPDEETDHPHHRSLWFTHGDVNGIDFWHEGRDNSGTIVQTGMSGMKMGTQPANMKVRCTWMGPDGAKVMEDERVYSFRKMPDGSIAIDFDITLKATAGEVTLGATKECGLGVRVIPTLRHEGEVAKGHIQNSEGEKDKDAWGKRAKWCDFYGEDRSGNQIGVAIFDHPDNLNHPGWWHARPYGLNSANAFSKLDFKKGEEKGEHIIPDGETLRLVYRVYVHPGNPETAKLNEAYESFVDQVQ